VQSFAGRGECHMDTHQHDRDPARTQPPHRWATCSQPTLGATARGRQVRSGLNMTRRHAKVKTSPPGFFDHPRSELRPNRQPRSLTHYRTMGCVAYPDFRLGPGGDHRTLRSDAVGGSRKSGRRTRTMCANIDRAASVDERPRGRYVDGVLRNMNS
jgi:hypothetical protein